MVIFYLEKLMYGLAAVICRAGAFCIFFFGFLYERDMNGYQFPTAIKLPDAYSEGGKGIHNDE